MEKAEGYSLLEKQIELLADESAVRVSEKNQDGVYGMSTAMSELAETILLMKLPLTAKIKAHLGNQIELLAEMSRENPTSAEKLIKWSEAMCALVHVLFAR